MVFVFSAANVFTKKELFDRITCTPSKTWTKNVKEKVVSYIITDNKKIKWGWINGTKSAISKVPWKLIFWANGKD